MAQTLRWSSLNSLRGETALDAEDDARVDVDGAGAGDERRSHPRLRANGCFRFDDTVLRQKK